MTNITVYDDTEKRLEELAEICDTTVAEIIDSLLDYADDVRHDYGV